MVSVIIINYNTFSLTTACLRSVYLHTRSVPFEVILVDNASTECDPEDFLKEFSALKLIKSKTNLGFAGGNNLGLSAASGTHYLLLNSDTLLTEDSIGKSYAFLLTQPQAGAVGCRQVYPDGKIQFVARRFRSIGWECFDLFRIFLYLLPYEKRAHLMLGRYFKNDVTCEADWVNGAFLLMPATIVRSLPGHQLDDRFFMYGEDVLWCEQIRELGYHIFFFAGTTIIHLEGGSTVPAKQMGLRKVMIRHERMIMARRKGKGLYYALFSIIYMGKEYARLLIKGLVFFCSGKWIR